MREVQVLQATKTALNSRGRNNNYAVQIDRIRVAAYCRVSTDGDEQLGSFESQKLYYEEKIRKNKEWAMAGIFADEAITGTKIDKREGFQEMIRKCLNGEIDMILTKSISRFSRNTPDTIKYQYAGYEWRNASDNFKFTGTGRSGIPFQKCENGITDENETGRTGWI